MTETAESGREDQGPEGGDDQPTQYRQGRFTRPDGACELILVRHGESAPLPHGGAFDLVDGHGDPPLHEPDGVEQARLACQRLIASGETFAAVYVSTLQRTRQTAAVLVDHLGVEPIVEPDLREVHLGDWEGGVYRQKLAEGGPIVEKIGRQQRWDAIPGAERQGAFSDRVRRALTSIAARHPNETVAVFTHGGFIGQAVCEATGARGFAFTGSDNCGITHLVINEDYWVVRTWNDTGHLTPRFTRDPEPLI